MTKGGGAMQALLGAVIALLLAVIAALLIKIHLMHKGAEEIARAFADRLETDTNTLIDLPTRDRYMCLLAAAVNEQLRTLRAQRQRYLRGDRELKEAITNISHDLRTPLTAICGYLELLDRQEKPPELERYLSLIADRVEAMKQMTEELFRYSVVVSAQEEMSLETVCINAVLEESIAGLYAALTERGIRPEIRMTPSPVERRLDKTALARVFGNILSNAVKYSDGDLWISLEDEGRITFSNAARELDSIQVGRLFDRFFTVDSARSSSGLGLSIAKALTERMGGNIAARYENGRLTIELQF